MTSFKPILNTCKRNKNSYLRIKSSSHPTSTTTRIETPTGDRPAETKYEHHILHPPQQGLKLSCIKPFEFAIRHHILHPPQQGLKPATSYLSISVSCIHHILHPPQQGLKRIPNCDCGSELRHHILHPPQQGLKLSSCIHKPKPTPHHILHPPQQGLKHAAQKHIATLQQASHPTSTTTRIETTYRLFAHYRYGRITSYIHHNKD